MTGDKPLTPSSSATARGARSRWSRGRARQHGSADGRRAIFGIGALAVVLGAAWWFALAGDGIDLVAAAGRSGPHPGGASSSVTGNPTAGEALYVQSCAACHGQQGAGSDVAPAIANAGPALVDFVLRTGRMPLANPTQPSVRKPPAFDDQEIADLVAYIASLGSGPAIPDVATSGADIARGRALFIQNCASCHGAAGAGGAVGGNIVAPPLSRADARTVGEAVTVGPGPMPAFSFSPQDLGALATYIESLRNPPSPGGLAVAEIGPVAEGFLAGSIGVVTLLVVARWIARGRPEDDEEPTVGAAATATRGPGSAATTGPGPAAATTGPGVTRSASPDGGDGSESGA